MACDSSSGSRPGVSHIKLHIHKAQPRGWEKKKQTNKHGLGSAHKRKKGSFVTLCIHPHICRLSTACILRETSTKATKMPTHLWLSSLTASLLLTILPQDCYHSPIGLFCSPLSTALSIFSSFLPPLPVSRWDLVLSPLCRVSRQSRQRDSLTGAHTHPTQRIATQCHINFIGSIGKLSLF